MPNVIKGKVSKSIREAYLTQRRRRAYPYDYFLLVEDDGTRKFPYREPESGKLHCGLLRAAITRAAQYGYGWVEDVARSKYKKYCKTKKEFDDEPGKEFKEEHQLRIIKEGSSDDFKGFVTGIVAEPDTEDAHGDVLTKDAIREAAYKYLENFQNIKYRHGRVLTKDQVALVESYVAPVDMAFGEEVVKEGSWLQTLHVKDEKLRKEIQEEKITGFSLGGWVEEIA